VSVLLVYESSAHPQRRSFPTRRSSDLTGEVSTTWNVLTWGDGLAPHDGFEFGQSGTPGKIGFVQLETETSPPLYRLAVVLGSSRSEEHTSELQSRENLVCRLLLEKKKK